MVIYVDDGYSSNGTNVQICADNGANAQRWRISPIDSDVEPCADMGLEGKCFEFSPKSNLAVACDVDSASPSNGASVQLWQKNGTLVQLFAFEFVATDGQRGFY